MNKYQTYTIKALIFFIIYCSYNIAVHSSKPHPMISNHNHYINDAYAKERQHSSSSSNYQGSQKSISQSSRFNGSNKFCQEYSFNRQSSFSRDSNQIQARQVYRPNNLSQGDSMNNRNPQLIKKYSSIYNQLQDIENLEVIHLFLQEIQQNQKFRTKIVETQVRMKGLQEENTQLKALLEKKRQTITKLCQTQSNNLNIIQCLQHQTDRKFNWQAHFLLKYQELQAYMNEYIASTNEAQEEFAKSFKILKSESQRLAQLHDKSQRENFENERMLQLITLRQVKSAQSLGVYKEKQRNLMIQIQNLQEENISLRKTVEELTQSLRSNEQFEVQLTKENRELSSELDFIRQKINENQSLSRDIFEKIQSHSQQTQRLTREKQQLENLFTKSMTQNECLLKQKIQIQSKLESLLKEFNQAISANERLMFEVEQKQKQIQELKEQCQMIKNEEQQLLYQFQNEKQSKHLIKSQLIDLAEQVKFMESTYKKEIIQNEKIKIELQRFWERSGSEPLKQMCQNDGINHHSSHAQSMKGSKSSFTKNSRTNYQHQTLF